MKATSRQKCLQAFQKLRRLQEADENGWIRCISSNRPYKWNDRVDGGHYIPRDCRVTELEPDNVFPQSVEDNWHKKGNPAQYRINLIEKIGLARVLRLENMQSADHGSDIAYNRLSNNDKIKVVQRKNNSEYDTLAKEYRKECRRLEHELPI